MKRIITSLIITLSTLNLLAQSDKINGGSDNGIVDKIDDGQEVNTGQAPDNFTVLVAY